MSSPVLSNSSVTSVMIQYKLKGSQLKIIGLQYRDICQTPSGLSSPHLRKNTREIEKRMMFVLLCFGVCELLMILFIWEFKSLKFKTL